MIPNNLSRRKMIQISGAALGAGTFAGVAGCVGEVPRAGTGGSGTSSYADWLPEPGAVASNNHYSFTRSDLTGIRNHEDRLDESLYDGFELMEDAISSTGVDFDEMGAFLSHQSVSVTTGSYKTSDVTSELEDNDFNDETEHEGDTIYLSADEVSAVGVSDQALLNYSSGGSVNALDAVETIIDTHLGAGDRYVNKSDALKTLLDALGTGVYLFGGTYEEEGETDPPSGLFEHSVAEGGRWQINGKTSNIKRVIVFEDQSDVATDDVSEWVSEYDGSSQVFDDIDDIDAQQQGRTAVITGTIDTDDVTGNHFS